MERDTDITVNLPRENYTKEGVLFPTPIWSTRPYTPAFQPAVNRDPGKTGSSTAPVQPPVPRTGSQSVSQNQRFNLRLSRNAGLTAGEIGGSTAFSSKPNRRFYRGVWAPVSRDFVIAMSRFLFSNNSMTD